MFYQTIKNGVYKCWLHFNQGIFALELRLGWNLPSFTLRIGGEESQLGLSARLVFVAVYLGLELRSLSFLQKARLLGFSFFEDVIFLYPFNLDDNGLRLQSPITINWKDILLGELAIKSELIVKEPVVFHYEKAYLGTKTGYKVESCRSRLFGLGKRNYFRCEIEIPEGIPVPSTNEWNSEEDAIYVFSINFLEEVDDGVKLFKKEVENTRRKYGGADWQPEAIA